MGASQISAPELNIKKQKNRRQNMQRRRIRAYTKKILIKQYLLEKKEYQISPLPGRKKEKN